MKKKLVFSIIFYIVAVLSIIFYLYTEFTKGLSLNEQGKLVILGVSCVFTYFGGIILSKYKDNKKPLKVNLWVFFILYLMFFISMTLFDNSWGRNGFNNITHWNKELFNEYISNSVNLIPFKTIFEYIKAFNSLYANKVVLLNLFGNLIACMPMAFFLPILFKKQNKFITFFITMIGIVFGIELLQFITLSGICDIDDLILNVAGSCILYGIIKIKSVNDLIQNIFLLEKNKISKKALTVIVCSILIIIACMGGIVKYRSRLYNDKLTNFMSKYNFDIEIIDESETCADALDKFYEDDYYIYYFSCIKSDKVYAIINGEVKYLVKDLLNNNPTEYHISIEKLEEAGLEFVKENKYEEININGKGTLNAKVKIENEDILNFKQANESMHSDMRNPENSSFDVQFFIIPYKAGKTEVEIQLYDSETGKYNYSIKYQVRVNDDLKVECEEIK